MKSLRDKGGNSYSYESPDDVNKIRWNWKVEHSDVFEACRRVVALRKNHSGFRMTSWDQIDGNVTTDDGLRHGVVVNRINAGANGDSSPEIIVIYNSADNYEYVLPSGTWFVAMEKSDPQAGNDRPVTARSRPREQP